jgi:hypothetical protein
MIGPRSREGHLYELLGTEWLPTHHPDRRKPHLRRAEFADLRHIEARLLGYYARGFNVICLISKGNASEQGPKQNFNLRD